MLVDHQLLTDGARILVFPASRKFYEQEIQGLEEGLKVFCDTLPVVEIGYELVYDRFIVFFISEETPIGLEENEAIIEFVQKLEAGMGIVLLDRMNVCYKQGAYVQRKEVPEFKKMIKNKSVSRKTLVFDNTVGTKGEYEAFWELPAGESWLSHFFR
jgi:hypothetical protein